MIFGRWWKPKPFSAVAASPNQAFSSETMYLSKCDHQPLSELLPATYSWSACSPASAFGIGR